MRGRTEQLLGIVLMVAFAILLPALLYVGLALIVAWSS